MTKEEVLSELRSIHERTARLIKSLERTPEAKRSEVPERDPEGFYSEPLEQFREPPKEVTQSVLCNCGLPAVKLSGEKNGRPWSGWFCNREKRDPKNCGFRKWD